MDRDSAGKFIKGHTAFKGMLGRSHATETRRKLSESHRGVKRGAHSEDWNKKISEAHLHRGLSWLKKCEQCYKNFKVYNYRPEARFCSSKCRAQKVMPTNRRYGAVPWNKGLTRFTDKRLKKIALERTGDKNWQFLHGNSKAHRTSWGSAIHKSWRKKVFERDKYTCQVCLKEGGELQADHIKCFAHHENFRYEVSNGRTLCRSCHKKTPNYGMHKKELCL